MALPGFELVYSSVSQQIGCKDAALIVAVHWNLISKGLKCCGVGEAWAEQNDNQSHSESLPAGWNSDNTIYCLRYVDPTANKKYLMKALAIDGTLILHLMRCSDEKTLSISVRSSDYVNDDYSNASSAFTNLGELNTRLTDELCSNILDGKQSTASQQATVSPSSSSTSTQPQRSPGYPGRSPLMVDPPNQGMPPGGIGFFPPRQPFRPSFHDPFSVGRADLDPLAAGQGGGMYMDPRNFPRPGFGPGNPFGGPPGFPPGSVPPGARFDPVGPPGVRPQPDPDHERPPDYDDMFM